jgi:hypothetical protein
MWDPHRRHFPPAIVDPNKLNPDLDRKFDSLAKSLQLFPPAMPAPRKVARIPVLGWREDE